MGFSSFTSALSGKDIFNVYREDKHEGICIVFTNSSFIFGNYDGYGRVLTKSGEIDVYVISALDGDLDSYFALDENEFEELRWFAIQEFSKGNLIIKAITENELFESLDADIDYEKLKPSENAMSQGYFQ